MGAGESGRPDDEAGGTATSANEPGGDDAAGAAEASDAGNLPSPGSGGKSGGPESSAGQRGLENGGAPGGGSANAGATANGGGMTSGGGDGGRVTTPHGGANTLDNGGRDAAGQGGALAGGPNVEPVSGGASGSGATGGSSGVAGDTSSGGANAGSPPCTFTVSASTSPAIPTVGSVEWSTTLTDLAHAEVVYSLDDPDADTLNRGGSAPVTLAESGQHTLLVGLKPLRNYTFHVEATAQSGFTCSSEDFPLTTGELTGLPAITRTALDPTAQAGGFIITTGGFGSSAPVAIVDADGDVVWSAPAPASASRARFDYEAQNLWVIAANAQNGSGDLRFISLDGLTTGSSFTGLEHVHHDFVALPGGVIATFAWSTSGIDQESDLLERSPDGSVKKLFHVGPNLYAGGPSALGGGPHSYHCNSLAYHASDDSFTIGDRNPSLFVKAKSSGELAWQFGGSCSGTKAPACIAGSWQVNHGHQLLDDGTFLFFNNTSYGSTNPSNADVFELTLSDGFRAASVKQWTGEGHEHSDTLGDVQRLPNGNTLVTFSNTGVIYELDATWTVVQILTASSFGYSEWRETLYGPPPR
jgi:hypothetical protein